jgi:hypothetical protein
MQKRLWKSLPKERESYDSRQVRPGRINITQAPVESWATPVVRFERTASLQVRSWSIRRGKRLQIGFLCWESGERIRHRRTET